MDAAGYDERFKKWRYDDLPILPEPFRYVLAPGKEDAFENLRALMDRSDVNTIVNACDAGREGEMIFRLMYEMAGCRKPVLRLWIFSMEDSAIREGFSDLRPGDDYEALYQSALRRQKADWLVGINATSLFSVLYHRTLNVGRVQTPTLAKLPPFDGCGNFFPLVEAMISDKDVSTITPLFPRWRLKKRISRLCSWAAQFVPAGLLQAAVCISGAVYG